MYDVVIIGKGPGGMSAGIYTVRAGLSTLLLDTDSSALKQAAVVENYFGIANPITGEQLLEEGRKQIRRLGVQEKSEEVVSIQHNDRFFTVKTDKGSHKTKTVILATGNPRKKSSINGIAEFEGRGISYCAVCDAFFYKGKTVGVLGSGAFALHETEALIDTVGKAIVFTNGEDATAAFPKEVQLVTEKISHIYGDDVIHGVTIEHGRQIPVSALFIALGTAGAAALASEIGIMTEDNRIIINDDMETNVPGIFAAGDCTGGTMQIAVAAAEGAKAGLSAIRFIKAQKNATS